MSPRRSSPGSSGLLSGPTERGPTSRRLVTIELVCHIVMMVIALFAVPSAVDAIRAGPVEEIRAPSSFTSVPGE